MDKQYFLSKLSHLNYSVATHPGDAKSRLGSQATYLFLISIDVIPEHFKKDFNVLIKLIKDENQINSVGMGIRFLGKKNTSIVKFIKLLIDIENEIRDELEEFKAIKN